MSVSIQTGDILSARVWTSANAQAAVNTYNYACITLTGGGVTDQDFANAFDTIAANLYGPLVTPQVTYDGVQVYFLKRTPMVLPNPVKSVASAGPGTAGGSILPLQTAGILKYNTNLRGPAGRGRVYLPFIASSFLTTLGEPTTAYDVLVNSFCSVLLSPLVVTNGASTATLVWSLVRRELLPAPPSSTEIVFAESAAKFGVMHKRGDYGRLNVSPI